MEKKESKTRKQPLNKTKDCSSKKIIKI